jgi:ankyrin repeat protein
VGLEAARILVEQDVGLIEMRDPRGQTPLHFAAQKGDYEMVKLFCDQNVTVIEKETDNGETALHYAARDGRLGRKAST